MKKFSDLAEREVLAVAIASEEEDGRIYMSFAENLAERYPESARIKYRSQNPEASAARKRRMKKRPKRQKAESVCVRGLGPVHHAKCSRRRGLPGSCAGSRHSHWRNVALACGTASERS
jgi:hypothetical protein